MSETRLTGAPENAGDAEALRRKEASRQWCIATGVDPDFHWDGQRNWQLVGLIDQHDQAVIDDLRKEVAELEARLTIPAAPGGGAGMVKAGWKLVPVEPTQEMWRAANEELVPVHDAAACWEAMLSAAPAPAVTETADAETWKDDPTSNDAWNAGCDFAMTQLCAYLGVDPASVNWDAATETLDGDVQSVIGNIMRAKYGEEWCSRDAHPPSEAIAALTKRAEEAEERGDEYERLYRAAHLDYVAAEYKLTAAEARIEEMSRALEPFSLMSAEGVVKPGSGYVTVKTCAEYFHRAREALSRTTQEAKP